MKISGFVGGALRFDTRTALLLTCSHSISTRTSPATIRECSAIRSPISLLIVL